MALVKIEGVWLNPDLVEFLTRRTASSTTVVFGGGTIRFELGEDDLALQLNTPRDPTVDQHRSFPDEERPDTTQGLGPSSSSDEIIEEG